MIFSNSENLLELKYIDVKNPKPEKILKVNFDELNLHKYCRRRC